ncbi:MAG: Synechococcus phage [Pseudomonadota bacterium]|jgi:hypothetical protein
MGHLNQKVSLIFLISLLQMAFPNKTFACTLNSYNLANGATQDINECNICARVTNNVGAALFIPTKTTAEWQAFLTNKPSGVTLGCCWSSMSFTSSGNQTFTPPAKYFPSGYNYCTQVHVVVVGGGGAGNNYYGSGGGGGALAYKNNITVSPGQSYTVTVGAGGTGGTSYTVQANSGGSSSFSNGSITVTAGGGYGGQPYPYGSRPSLGGTVSGTYDGSGAGGTSGLYSYSSPSYKSSGGGGAGGYGGKGGDGAGSSAAGAGTFSSATAGVSGGGGGGGSSTVGSYTGAGGGGVGLFGLGSNGAAGSTVGDVSAPGGGGGSGGSAGNSSVTHSSGSRPSGGAYGGGGGSNHNTNYAGGNGAGGAVRIMWGSGRSFPSTNASSTNELAL